MYRDVSECACMMAMDSTYRNEVWAQATNRIFGYIRGQLTDGGAKGEYANFFVALDEPVRNLILHKDIAATWSGSIGNSLSREQQLDEEDLKWMEWVKQLNQGNFAPRFS